MPQLEFFKSNIFYNVHKTHKVGTRWADSCKSCIEVYANIFRSNPQLKCVDLSEYSISGNLFEALNNLQNLETLKIRFSYLRFREFNGRTIHLKNLKHLDILHVYEEDIYYGFGKTNYTQIFPF